MTPQKIEAKPVLRTLFRISRFGPLAERLFAADSQDGTRRRRENPLGYAPEKELRKASPAVRPDYDEINTFGAGDQDDSS